MKEKKLFYGWIDLGALWVCYLLIMGAITYTFGVVVSDMVRDLKMTMTVASGGYTGYNLANALLAPAMGKFTSKYGTKKCLMLGTLSMVIGTAIMAFFVQSVVVYYVVWIVFIGIGVRFGSLSPCQINISNWFFRKRGMAMAIFLTAGGVGGFIFAPLMNSVRNTFSWRHVWMVLMLCSLLAFLTALIFVKEKPADVGQEIDGGTTAAIQKEKITRTYKSSDPWTLSEVRKQPVYYQIIFFQFCVAFLMIAIGNQGINHMVQIGLTSEVAAAAIATFSLVNTLGRLLVGFVSDRFEMRFLLVGGAILVMIGLIALCFAETKALAYMFAACTGLGYGIYIVAPANIILNYFGTHDYANINANFNLVSGLVGGFNSVIIGALFDLTGSYYIIWAITCVFMLISIVAALKTKPPIYKPN